MRGWQRGPVASGGALLALGLDLTFSLPQVCSMSVASNTNLLPQRPTARFGGLRLTAEVAAWQLRDFTCRLRILLSCFSLVERRSDGVAAWETRVPRGASVRATYTSKSARHRHVVFCNAIRERVEVRPENPERLAAQGIGGRPPQPGDRYTPLVRTWFYG